MFSALDKLPPWLGSIPAWTTLIVVLGYIVIQWLKSRPTMEQHKLEGKKLESEERFKIRDRYLEEIQGLRADVKACQDTCDERETALQKIIDDLKAKMNNEAMQRVQSEISLVNTLIQVVDAPQLKIILSALEARQVRMLEVQPVGGPIGDSEKGAE